jgi:hypothetical protein
MAGSSPDIPAARGQCAKGAATAALGPVAILMQTRSLDRASALDRALDLVPAVGLCRCSRVVQRLIFVVPRPFAGLTRMRKRFIAPVQQETASPDQDWLNVDDLVEVEITSENVAHPIESALLPGHASGWRAAGPGKQTIRLFFAHPQLLRRTFVEPLTERTQEYVLRWSPDGGQSFREIVRQQWNFSPQGATSETEDHHVELPGVTVLELSIIPDMSRENAFAPLAQLRLA